MFKKKRVTPIVCATTLFFTISICAAQAQSVEISEIAWMGTTNSTSDEWLELHNPGGSTVDLTGWTLAAEDGTPSVTLSGTIAAGGFFLLERTDDDSVPGIAASQIYSGALENGGETLVLRDGSGAEIDRVTGWSAGDNNTKATMERVAGQWQTATASYDVGFGTPAATATGSGGSGTGTQQFLNQVGNAPDSINVYFNKSALTDYASTGNAANYQINLEERLVSRIMQAQNRIDMATYEINLPAIADALVDRASHGVAVRVIADAKGSSDPEHDARYELMRMTLERMVRGADGIVGTADDIALFSDSPIFAVEDSAKRTAEGLPVNPDGLFFTTLNVGNGTESGYLLAQAEEKAPGSHYSPGEQMHNKFVVIDDMWVWTGSWNFTTTGLYGTDENRAAGILDGNTQHSIEINSTALADAFTQEFNEMWGASGFVPNMAISNFHGRKSDNTPHIFTIGGRLVELYFSPGDGAVDRLTGLVSQDADQSAYFSIFAWSDQPLVDALKVKWEGSAADLQGTLTGFDVKGVFDKSFWNQWWSASIEMTGRTASQSSINNPNIRWNNPAPVFMDNETRKLHSKTMIVDVCSLSDPTVIVGSTNWSANGEDVNDENMLIIHDFDIANQFLQEFYARYQAAGGTVPDPAGFVCE